jgi:uncharacterized OB-fold protein
MPLFGPSMPLPCLDEDTRLFWEACREHRLTVQQCVRCEAFRFAPAPICYGCQSFETRLVESEGIGELYTWTVTHRAVHPATSEMVPYNTAVVKLRDCGGALITTNIVGIDNGALVAGMIVELEWDDVTPDISLPRFRPVGINPKEVRR